MSVGVVMLVHTALHRAEQVVRHWADAGCPVVVHVDKIVDRDTYDAFVESLKDLPDVQFSKRHRCPWGTWGIVAASQSASELLLEQFPGVRHVYLASGACLPLRPVKDLIAYLETHPRTDFIESATVDNVPWTKGGLDRERFTLFFPFAWRQSRFLFDLSVSLQRRLKLRRTIPNGIQPHLGSQWWCLTRETLSAILTSPNRRAHDRYFRSVWIPDESYFQTLARPYSQKLESRSLTLAKFDHQGKPHVFYDDHLQLLRRSDCFVVRKIWPQADTLYDHFLNQSNPQRGAEPNPGKIDRIFAKAVDRRTHGRPGLLMQSRLPRPGFENGLTAAPYSVFQGFTDLFEDFETWLAKVSGTTVHGHLYGPDRAEFDKGVSTFKGCLSNNPRLRDHLGNGFLMNLIWNTRGERQCFQFGPRDNQTISWPIAKDNNAQISVITGAWAIPMFRSAYDFAELRAEAAQLQRIEAAHVDALRSHWSRARIRIWTLAEFIETPMESLQTILDEMGVKNSNPVTEAPRMVDLKGFAKFLQNLRNQGMDPYLVGDFPAEPETIPAPNTPRRPYLVR